MEVPAAGRQWRLNHLLINLHLLPANQRIDWLGTKLSLWSITLVDVWQWTALPLLIVYSGRVSLPPAIYEAAQVDGASELDGIAPHHSADAERGHCHRVHHPLHGRLQIHRSCIGDNPGRTVGSSELPVYIAFQKGIREFQVGEAAAQAWLIFAVAAVLITLFLRYMKRVLKAQGIA